MDGAVDGPDARVAATWLLQGYCMCNGRGLFRIGVMQPAAVLLAGLAAFMIIRDETVAPQ